MKTQVAHLLHRSLRYFESGEGRPLVLLHAFPLSADQWLPQLHRVPNGWRFIAPDLRGFRGAGAAFEDPGLTGLSMGDYAEDVLALMTHLDLERAADREHRGCRSGWCGHGDSCTASILASPRDASPGPACLTVRGTKKGGRDGRP